MKKNYLVFLMMIFLFSCSSVGKRTVAESEVVSKDIVIERGIEEISKSLEKKSVEKT